MKTSSEHHQPIWMRKTLYLFVIPFLASLPFTWYFTGHVPEWSGGDFKAMAFAPKNDALAVVSSHGPMGESGAYAPIRFLKTRDGIESQPPLRLEDMVGSSVETWQRQVAKVEYSPQGDRIAVLLDQVMQPLHRELILVDLASRKRDVYITVPMDPGFADFKTALPASIFSPDGKWIVTTANAEGKRTVRLWNSENGEEHLHRKCQASQQETFRAIGV